LAIISSAINDIGYRIDDHENTISVASQLLVDKNGEILEGYNEGIIETRLDVVIFEFESLGYPIRIELEVAKPTNNLDPLVRLLNSNGDLLKTYNPTDAYDILIQENLPQGTYYLEIDGVGLLDPIVDGYSDYASVGYYSLKGSLNYNDQVVFDPFIEIVYPLANSNVDPNAFTHIDFEIISDDFDGDITSCLFKINGQSFPPIKVLNSYSYSFPIQIYGNYTFGAIALNNEGKLISKTINFTVLPNATIQFNVLAPSNFSEYYMKGFEEIDFEVEVANYVGSIQSANLNIANSVIPLELKGGKLYAEWLPASYGVSDHWITLNDLNGTSTSQYSVKVYAAIFPYSKACLIFL
jgi:hypothetical protein